MNFDKLDKLMDSMQARYGVPGCQVWVYYNHRIAHRYSAGFADEAKTRPVSERDLYILYSATKVITNVAMMRLVEQGKLGLEDELSRYLPEFSRMQVQTPEGVRPAERAITIRDLSTMRAGLSYNLNTPYIQAARQAGKRTTREMMTAIAEEPLLFEPSTHFNYSLCHDVLGAVIEVVSGMRFGEYLRREIFAPLGMEDTTFHPTAEQQERITAQYQYEPETNRVRLISHDNPFALTDAYESGGAGLYATAPDYLRFAAALANYGRADNGYQLLTPQSVDRMRQDELSGACRQDFDAIGRVGYSYGLGVRTMANPERYGFRTPKGEFGWDGAACSYVSIDPAHGLALFYGMQVMGYSAMYDEVHPAIREIVYETILG